jgi:hypothetical protein
VVILSGNNVKEPMKVSFKTVDSEKHVSFVANRIWGGMQAGNLFELNFILEHKPLPEKITMQIETNGIEREISRSQSNEVIRENQATAYLGLETLIALTNWLNAVVRDLQASKIIEVTEHVSQNLQGTKISEADQ